MPVKPIPESRALYRGTAKTLVNELRIVFPKAKFEFTDVGAIDVPREGSEGFRIKPRIIWDAASKRVFAFIYGADLQEAQQAVILHPLQAPDVLDLQFARTYMRVFETDLSNAPLTLKHNELWEALGHSRTSRAISRLTAFSTPAFLHWLNTFEAAAHLRYEGDAFHASVFLTKKIQWITDVASAGFIPFEYPLPFRQALLREKWVRTLAGGADIGLVGLGHAGDIVGVVTVPNFAHDVADKRVLPSDLRGAVSLVRPGTMALLAANNGDLYVVLPSGAVFVKSQGAWQYLNYRSFQALLSQYVPEALAQIVLQLAVDLSFARRGSLLCLPKDLNSITSLVPDHLNPKRPNRALRQAAANIVLDSEAQLPALRGIAGADGAIVIGDNGRVLDAACMIGQPDERALNAVGVNQLQRFEGARTTAAWNASIFGVAIKISDDGPISLFAGGRLVGQIG